MKKNATAKPTPTAIERIDDAAAQLVEMLQERHLAALVGRRLGVVVVPVGLGFVERLATPCWETAPVPCGRYADVPVLVRLTVGSSGAGSSTVADVGVKIVSGVSRGPGDRRGLLRLDLGPLFLLFLDPDFLLERALQLVRGLLELADALAQRTAELGQLPRPEDDQRDHQDDDQLGHADGSRSIIVDSRGNSRKCFIGL